MYVSNRGLRCDRLPTRSSIAGATFNWSAQSCGWKNGLPKCTFTIHIVNYFHWSIIVSQIYKCTVYICTWFVSFSVEENPDGVIVADENWVGGLVIVANRWRCSDAFSTVWNFHFSLNSFFLLSTSSIFFFSWSLIINDVSCKNKMY